jgi:MFS family permease
MTVDGVRRRFLWLLWLRWLPIGLIAPLLVLFLVDRGLTLAQVGVVMAVYGITTAVFELPTGGLADTLGRRPVLLLSSLLGMAFIALALVLRGVVGLSVAAFVGGLSRALDSGPLEAWFVDTTRAIDPEAKLERGLSLGATLDGAALALGAIAGGFLPQLFDSQLAVSLVAALALLGVHFVAVAFLMTEHPQAAPGRLRLAFARIPQVVRAGTALTVRHRYLRRLMLGYVAIGIGISAIEVLWQPRFATLLGNAASETGFFGILLAVAFGASALGALGAPWLRRRFRGRIAQALTVAQGLMGVAVLALAASGALIAAAVGFVAVYLFNGLMTPYLRELLHEHVPADCRTTMVSVTSLSLQSGGFASALTLPAMAAVYGIPVAWAVGGSILALAALLYVGVPNRARTGIVLRESVT